MATFDSLWREWPWRAIPSCPGRFVLAAAGAPPPLAQLLGAGAAPLSFRSERARDPVLVAPLPNGCGLISYVREGGALLHTLNTAEGFARKLAQLGIELPGPPAEGAAQPKPPADADARRAAELRAALDNFLRSQNLYDALRHVVSDALRPHLGEGAHARAAERAAVDALLAAAPLPAPGGGGGALRLVVRAQSGRSFLDFLSRGEAREGARDTAALHVQFGAARARSAAVAATVEPRFDAQFEFELPPPPPAQPAGDPFAHLLPLAMPLRLAVTRHAGEGDARLVAARDVEWRHVLRHGRCALLAELTGAEGGLRAPAGLLQLDLALAPLPEAPLREDALPCFVGGERLAEHLRREAAARATVERRFRVYAKAWWRELVGADAAVARRLVRLFALGDAGDLQFACRFLAPLRAARVLDSPLHAARFVSLLPLQREAPLGGGRADAWGSLHSLLAAGRGEAEPHALLLCALLLGFGLDAYCCVGEAADGAPAMFVATRRHASAAVLWDPLSGRRFDLVELAARAAAAASAAAAEPPLPMRSVHCAFNHVSFFANVQRADSVLAVTWDFEAAAHWRALSAEAIALLPAAPAPALAPCSLSPAREAELLEARLRALVAEFRAQQCGLPTAWDSALGELLSPALASYEAERAVGAGFAGDDVELAVRRALPLGAVFRAFPAQFPHRNAAAILTALSQARGGALLETLRLDAEDLFFAVRARVVPYAEEVAATWVVVAARFRAPPPPPPPA